jgi:SagB-type dehydrogenase family enzyme
MDMESIEEFRAFLKAELWSEWGRLERDQAKGIPHPPLQKPVPPDAVRVDLVAPSGLSVGTMPLIEAINRRQSHRKFTEEPLTLEELSFLLWTSQGVHRVWREGVATRRTVPSAGSRHPFETYLLVYRAVGLEPGLYRYLALEHQLCLLKTEDSLDVPDQWFLRNCAVTFVWTVIPYRTEWRYSILAHKPIALDAGHVCQNLYLSCAAIDAGTCAIGAYNQDEMDALLDIDGVEEFTIYVAPVGKI